MTYFLYVWCRATVFCAQVHHGKVWCCFDILGRRRVINEKSSSRVALAEANELIIVWHPLTASSTFSLIVLPRCLLRSPSYELCIMKNKHTEHTGLLQRR